MTREERIDQIERYLRQEMGPDERAAFEALLHTDVALQEALAVHAGVHDLARRQHFEQQVAMADREYFAGQALSRQPGGRSRMLYWSVAAAVVLLAAAGIFVFTPKAPTSDELFTEYFAHYEVPAVLRSDEPLYNIPDTQASFLMYRERQYSAAIPGFTKALEQSPQDMLIVFCRGISYLATGDAGKAEQDLKTVIQHHDNVFVNQARWYLALSYVKAGQTAAARSLLSTLDDPRAQSLLQALGP